MVPEEDEDVHLGFIAPADRAALRKPVFIVEHDGVYYAAVALLEYDINAADTEEQKKGCAEVRRMHETAGRHTQAARFEESWDWAAAVFTGPKPPKRLQA